MLRQRATARQRRTTIILEAGVRLAVAAAMGLAVSGEAQREWRDYAGGPDSSRFVDATHITSSNVQQLQVAWTYPSGRTDFNPLVVRGMAPPEAPNTIFTEDTAEAPICSGTA